MGKGSAESRPTPSDKQGGLDANDARGIREAAAAFRNLIQESYLEKVYWYFSIKGQQYFEVRGDTCLMMVVLDEFDQNVTRIEIEAPTAVEAVEGEPTGTRLDATVSYRSGRTVLKEAKRKEALDHGDERSKHQIEAQKLAAARRGAEYQLVLDEDLRSEQVRFWNCLALLGWYNRGRGVSSTAAEKALHDYLDRKSGARLEDLLALPEVDVALVLSVVARRTAFGTLHADLSRPLTRKTYFSVAPVAALPEPELGKPVSSRAAPPKQRLPPRGDFGDIPLEMLDMERWPVVDEAFVRDKQLFVRRRDAVLMYYEGCKPGEIKKQCGLTDAAVHSLVRKCAAAGVAGEPKGFPALIKFGYLRGYTRKSPPQTSSRSEGRRGGWAGEFERLLTRFPDLIKVLEDQTLEAGRSVSGKRLKWSDIRDKFITACQEKIADKTIPPESRLTKDSYPFNTKRLAYYSVIAFCKELKKGKRSRWVAKRYGEAAAKRAMLGSGKQALFTPNAPYQAAAGDFYKVDFETVIHQDLPAGETLDVLLPRWFIGSIVCLEGGFPIVDSLSFELQQTTEDVLALGARLVRTPASCPQLSALYKNAPDGKWLPGQIVPALANNGVDLLLLDRAWSSQAHQSLAKLSQATGAVLGFCAAAAWEQKAPVERHFADLVQGLHTVASTVGSGPKDFRRKDAAAMAVRYDINVERTVQRIRSEMRKILSHNGAGSYGLGHVERLHQLALNHASNWLPRPIPKARVEDNPLDWIDLDATIVAGTEANSRIPHVRPLGIRFHGESIAARADLTGRSVVVQIKRERFNEARVVLSGSGTVLGKVRPERRYHAEGLTYRMVRLILQKRSVADIHEATTNPALDFAEQNKAVIAARRKKKGAATRTKPEAVRGRREGLIAAAMTPVASATSGPEVLATTPAAAAEVVTPAEPNSALSKVAQPTFRLGSFSRNHR